MGILPPSSGDPAAFSNCHDAAFHQVIQSSSLDSALSYSTSSPSLLRTPSPLSSLRFLGALKFLSDFVISLACKVEYFVATTVGALSGSVGESAASFR